MNSLNTNEVNTDENPSDIVVTIKEQAETLKANLLYASEHEYSSLLNITGNGSSHFPESFEILPSLTVSRNDVRRRLLDIEGVRQAWLVSGDVSAGEANSSYLLAVDEDQELDPYPEAEKVLRNSRLLGQNFLPLKGLNEKGVVVKMSVKLKSNGDRELFKSKVHELLNQYVTPDVPRRSVKELEALGLGPEQIYAGPRLEGGQILDEELASVVFPKAFYASRIIEMLYDLPELSQVQGMTLGYLKDENDLNLDANMQDWILKVEHEESGLPEYAPYYAGAIFVIDSVEEVIVPYLPPPREITENRLYSRETNGMGAKTRVITSHSLLPLFPQNYRLGVESGGARNQNLSAYLAFFEQVLVNMQGQLAHLPELFRLEKESISSYQTVDLSDYPQYEGIIEEDLNKREELSEDAELMELDRQNRLADVLLTMLGEPITEDNRVLGLASEANQLSLKRRYLDIKRKFLATYKDPQHNAWFSYAYPKDLVSSEFPDDEVFVRNFKWKICTLLGIAPHMNDGIENFFILEHHFLRPTDSTEEEIPFEQSMSVFVPEFLGRFADEGFRILFEETLRRESPAHLALYVHWLDSEWELLTFKNMYGAWLAEPENEGAKLKLRTELKSNLEDLPDDGIPPQVGDDMGFGLVMEVDSAERIFWVLGNSHPAGNAAWSVYNDANTPLDYHRSDLDWTFLDSAQLLDSSIVRELVQADGPIWTGQTIDEVEHLADCLLIESDVLGMDNHDADSLYQIRYRVKLSY